jgi:hypothetical protein
MQILNYNISNTNSTNGGQSFVRVYNYKGELIAEIGVNKRNPLGYIRGVTNSKHKRSLYEQCLAGGMDEGDFYPIFGDVKLAKPDNKN